MNRYLCIHGHFYQPPRENPWLEEVELQDSAYPYHDWNERITVECYAPNMASRILDKENKIIDLINNYSKISFNFGPTLLSWMEKHMPDIYKRIIEADKLSREKFSGHGSAIAQAYNHMIMPLANLKDKRTQVVWGIKDFFYRFSRRPEGMWLAETAVDLQTLDIMAELGIKFVILSPDQAEKVKKIGKKEWTDVRKGKIDPKMSYRCKLPSGKAITIFFYDGPISQDVAFSDLLINGKNFANRLMGAFSDERTLPQLVHIGTDGETYGHHHPYAEMALSYGLYHIESNKLAKITIYGEYLEKFPPTHQVQIIENSSWSCFHGVERWQSDCGCNSGLHPTWKQAWRAPLRGAMDWLRDNLIVIYEKQISKFVKDPWQARDSYIDIVLSRTEDKINDFLRNHTFTKLSGEEKIQVLKLLEMQRHAMLMYTSCGWFFDEISGIETVQVMHYAARAMQLAKEISGVSLEKAYIKLLKKAPSNVAAFRNGANVYEKLVQPAILDNHRVGAHYAVSSIFKDYPKTSKIYCYTTESKIHERVEAGRQKIVIGCARVRSDITQEENMISFAAVHLGDHNIVGGVRDYNGEEPFQSMHQELKESFLKSDIAEIIHLIDKHFGSHNYSLWHLFKDEQRKVIDQILDSTLKEIEGAFRQINEHHYSVMQVIKEIGIPLPKIFSTTLEFILNADIRNVLEGDEQNLNRLQGLVEEADRWSFKLDKPMLGFVASRRINSLMKILDEIPEDVFLIITIKDIFRILEPLSLHLSLWQAQNIFFSISKKLYRNMQERVKDNDKFAREWVENFDDLSNYLRIKSK